MSLSLRLRTAHVTGHDSRAGTPAPRILSAEEAPRQEEQDDDVLLKATRQLKKTIAGDNDL